MTPVKGSRLEGALVNSTDTERLCRTCKETKEISHRDAPRMPRLSSRERLLKWLRAA